MERTPHEIVLTYRPAEQTEIQLCYERELPGRMTHPLPQFIPCQRKKAGWRYSSLLIFCLAVVCIGTGLWALQREIPVRENHSQDSETEGPDYYWSYEPEQTAAETTIALYRPSEEEMAVLELVEMAEDAPVLTSGEVYKKVSPAVVAVQGEQEGSEGVSVGTGVIFDASGYVITNYHVIQGCSDCHIWITDQYGVDAEYDALLVGGDAQQDLAVLKIQGEEPFPTAEFGVSDALSVGDTVYAIGNPLGFELRNTLTDGIVSAVNRNVEVDGYTMTLVQTNAALNSGNSGGPLINQYGQIVGINTIKMMGGMETIEGLGFAIPTSLAVRWVNDLIREGEVQPQPVLGLSINRIPVSLPDGKTALEVAEVTPDSSADHCGIQVGDCLVSFHGQEAVSVDQVLAIRRTLSVGDKVAVRIWRAGEYLDLTMTMMAATQ